MEDVSRTNEWTKLSLIHRYPSVMYSVDSMVCDFMLAWRDYMSRIDDLIRKEYTLFHLQSDVGFSKKSADEFSVYYVLARSSREDYYVVKLEKGRLPLEWGKYSVLGTLKGSGCFLQTEWHTSKLLKSTVRVDFCLLTAVGVEFDTSVAATRVESPKYLGVYQGFYAFVHFQKWI